jgi:putative heme-binding domain-containing protein
MPGDWRDSDTAPLIRLLLVAGLGLSALALATAAFLFLSRPTVETDRSGLAERAAALTSPRDQRGPLLVPVEGSERDMQVREGFQVELVYQVPPEQGSWVSLTVDQQGRLLASDQSGGLYRLSDGQARQLETPVGAAQGLLCIDGDLYCVVAGERAQGPGLYRLRDADGDGVYEHYELLRALNSGGEHGPHGIVLGPDGMLYIVAGNHTNLPEPQRSVVPRRWAEDILLPRLWDARGHATGILAPGGWICRTDRDGETWELFAIGFRNVYDIAFNHDGELFAYDADMEWDMGAPWYRPTRINHVVSGAEFGWRSGTGKWPTHVPDSLPGVLDMGPGSPAGVCFGYGTDFPQRYQDALYALDWTFGTIYAIHLEPHGSTYRATAEPFITGRPLPVADAVVNPADGGLYFLVGGRGTASAVYRVRYTPDRQNEPTDVVASPQARTIRRRMEQLHGAASSIEVIDAVWPQLGSDDRFIAHAARVALEHQPTESWAVRALNEPDVPTKLNALVAVARCADKTVQPDLIASLGSIDPAALDRTSRLAWLRCWALCFMRLGAPDDATAEAVAARLEPMYPSGDDATDRALCDLLVYLRSPTVVAQTIPLMERADDHVESIDRSLVSRNDTYGSAIIKMAAAMPQQQQVHYALALSNATRGWSPSLRRRYFQWFNTAQQTRGGLSFAGFLDQIRLSALEHVPEAQRAVYGPPGTGSSPELLNVLPVPQGPGRAWTVQEVVALVDDGLSNRDFENGERMYAAAMCATCHRFAGTGLAGGPDLTQVASRYSVLELIESIVEPSRTISDQYEQTQFILDDDQVVIGRVVGRDAQALQVMPSMLTPGTTTRIPLDRIVRQEPSTVSAMMPALLNRLNADEVRDLLAYLLSEGDRRDPMFKE